MDSPELTFLSRTPIMKGWSGDRKYCVTVSGGERCLFRVSDATQYERKAQEYALMQRMDALGIPMCRPLAFGMCDEGVYSLQSWIDGEDAEDYIPTLPYARQYAYGVDAGHILYRIHALPAPLEGQIDWAVRFGAKMDRKIRMYRACPLQFDGADAIIAYLEAHRHLLDNRPQACQHGDYHIGNMMVDNANAGKLVIIDWNRYDYGDPWEEFNRIVWCAQASPSFAAGMVDGYFAGAVPDAFWELLALYVGSNMLSSIPWAIDFGEAEVKTMLNQAQDVLRWYDGMRNPVPTWYQVGVACSEHDLDGKT